MAGDPELDARAIWTRLAAGWKKHDAMHTRLTAGVTARMLAGVQPGHRVLDIACGTGDPALAAAERVGASGKVHGVDLVEELLDHARAQAAAHGLAHVELSCGDGASLAFAGAAAFDRVTIRWGLMYMPDPAACLAEAYRVLVPGGVLAIACWAAAKLNPWATVLPLALMRHAELPPAGPGAPGPFSLADRDQLHALVEAAGFTAIEIEAVELPMSDFERGVDFVAYRLETSGPLTAMIMALPEAVREAVLADAAVDAERRGGGHARLPGVTWVVMASR